MIEISPSSAKLLADLAELGIDLQLHGDAIRFRPLCAMTPALLKQLQTNKAEFLKFLNTEAVVAELRESIAILWKNLNWLSAWERRLRTATYANFDSLRRVLESIICGAAELHRRHEWGSFASTCEFLFRFASGEIWDQTVIMPGQISLDLTDLQ